MKKFLAVVILSIILFVFKANSVSAQCSPAGTAGQCPRGLITCGLGGTNYCCPQISGGNSCSQLSGSVQATIPPNGGLAPSNSDPTAGCGKESINTAIGCIPVGDTNQFMGFILGWAVGIGGGIAFLLIVYASFMIMTSQGAPDRLKAGQELLTSAISGLIMLVFSIFILKFIGIDILGLDQFGFGK